MGYCFAFGVSRIAFNSSYSLETGFTGVVGCTGASENDASAEVPASGESVFSSRDRFVLLSYELGLLRNFVGFCGFGFRAYFFSDAPRTALLFASCCAADICVRPKIKSISG